jgi:hypothetical protein
VSHDPNWATIASSKEWQSFWQSQTVRGMYAERDKMLKHDDTEERSVQRLIGWLQCFELLRSLPETRARNQTRVARLTDPQGDAKPSGPPAIPSSTLPGKVRDGGEGGVDVG